MITKDLSHCIHLWITLFIINSSARLCYLINNTQKLYKEDVRPSNLFFVLFSALRFDSSAAGFVVTPIFLPLLFFSNAFIYDIWSKIFISIFCLLNVIHYNHPKINIDDEIIGLGYYTTKFKREGREKIRSIRYEDNLKITTYEVTAKSTLHDNINKLTYSEMLFAGAGTLFFWLFNNMPFYLETTHNPIKMYCISFFILAIMTRATFHPIALHRCNRPRGFATLSAPSNNMFINSLHTNPIYSLIYLMQDNQNYDMTISISHKKNIYEDFKDIKPSNSNIVVDNGRYTFQQTIHPSNILNKRPKHIVIFCLESHNSWAEQLKDPLINNIMNAGFKQLIQRGYLFPTHFAIGHGTIQNIESIHKGMIYRNYLNVLKSSLLLSTVSNHRYETNFYYGGSHREKTIDASLLQNYDNTYFEKDLPNANHSESGLYGDYDLYNQLHQHLKNKETPSFSFVMSGTNHSPWIYPKELIIPAPLNKYITVENAQAIAKGFGYSDISRGVQDLKDFIKAWIYADQCLSRFFTKARKEDYFKDTLFILTADHSAGTWYGAHPIYHNTNKNVLAYHKLPLLFYAPKLMNENYIGQTNTQITTHLDIIPSLLSLITPRTMTINTWGTNIFDKKILNTSFMENLSELDLIKISELWARDGTFAKKFEEQHNNICKEVSKQFDMKKIKTLRQKYLNAIIHYLQI